MRAAYWQYPVWYRHIVLHCIAEDDILTGGLFSPGFTDFADAKVSISLPSENFCRALFDMYIGPESIVPDGRKQYVQDTLGLLKL